MAGFLESVRAVYGSEKICIHSKKKKKKTVGMQRIKKSVKKKASMSLNADVLECVTLPEAVNVLPLQSTPLDLIETGRGLKFQAERPHLVSLGSGRLSVAITLLPLPEGERGAVTLLLTWLLN